MKTDRRVTPWACPGSEPAAIGVLIRARFAVAGRFDDAPIVADGRGGVVVTTAKEGYPTSWRCTPMARDIMVGVEVRGRV